MRRTLNKPWRFLLALLPGCAAWSGTAWAADSYRWLHVTIDTPWAIFIFLLPMVLVPVVLMAILYWRFAIMGANKKNDRSESKESPESVTPEE